MPGLGDIEKGQSVVRELAQTHGVSEDAVVALANSLARSNGGQAQFSHPDLGGMGQWSRGGMIMIGDMFNNDLKAKVDRLCRELSERMAEGSIEIAERPSASWLPKDLGRPNSTGEQNATGYAFFPEARRLVIRRDGDVRQYDAGDHHISGVSQQQGSGQELAFTSQLGTVCVHELAPVEPSSASRPKADVAPRQGGPAPEGQSQASEPDRSSSSDDVFGKIERLHELHRKGILSDDEFSEKKKHLLSRI